MRYTTMTQQRPKGTTLASVIPMYLEVMAYRVAVELGGQSPAFSYWAAPTGGTVLDVRSGDYFYDENQIDPKTLLPTAYRVFGNAEPGDAYADIPMEKIIGTQ
jgi:hypothetical protein